MYEEWGGDVFVFLSTSPHKSYCLSESRAVLRGGSVFLCLTHRIVCCIGNYIATKQKEYAMRSKHKLQVKAHIMKQITEVYVMDCDGMSVDEIKEWMGHAYIEDLPEWEWINTETDHHEIEMKLEIVRNDG